MTVLVNSSQTDHHFFDSKSVLDKESRFTLVDIYKTLLTREKEKKGVFPVSFGRTLLTKYAQFSYSLAFPALTNVRRI